MSVTPSDYQEKITTAEEAVANLKEATELYMEEFGPTTFSRPFVTTFDVAVNA